MSGSGSRAAVAWIALALSGCAPTAALMTPPPSVKPGPGQGDETTGGIEFAAGGVGSSIAYGPWRVKGEGIDLAYAGDGAWAGTWNGSAARFTASQGLLQGPGTAVRIDQRDGALALRGTWAGRPIDLTVSRTGLQGTTSQGACSLDLRSTGTGNLTGSLGCPGGEGRPATSATGRLRLLGEAVLVPDVLLPQFVLALLTALP